MIINPLAGKPAEQDMLVNVPRLVSAYYTGKPDTAIPDQCVAFGFAGINAAGSAILDITITIKRIEKLSNPLLKK